MDLHFDGIENATAVIQANISSRRLSYLSLHRRREGGEEKVGRMDMPDWDELEEHDPEDWVERSMEWLRGTMVSAYEGDPPVEGQLRFRVRLYGPKGIERLGALTLTVNAIGLDETPPAGTTVLSSVQGFPRARPHSGDSGVFRDHTEALGDAYKNFVAFMTTSITDVQRITRSQQDHSNADLARSRAQVDRLLAAVINLKMDAVEAKEATLRAQQTQNQDAIALELFREIQKTAQTLAFQSQGVSPIVQTMAEVAEAAPELVQMLKDPALMELLKQPATRAMLVSMLQHFVSQLGQRGGGGQAPPGGIPPVPGAADA